MKMTTKKRNALPKAAFADPTMRKYPIPDQNHARNALARVSANGTPAEKKKVRAAVAKKFPGIAQASKPMPKGRKKAK